MQPLPEGIYQYKRIEDYGTEDHFATGNQGKMREIRAILSDLGLPVLSMKEAGVSLDITEDGTSFAENARIKARAVWEHTGGIVLQMIPVWQWIISAASRALFCAVYGRGYLL